MTVEGRNQGRFAAVPSVRVNAECLSIREDCGVGDELTARRDFWDRRCPRCLDSTPAIRGSDLADPELTPLQVVAALSVNSEGDGLLSRRKRGRSLERQETVEDHSS